MGIYMVTVGIERDDDSPYMDIIDASKAEAEALRAQGQAMVELAGDLYQFDVEEVPLFTVAGIRATYAEYLTLSPGDGEPLDTYPAGTDIGTYVADGNGPERDFIAGEPT